MSSMGTKYFLDIPVWATQQQPPGSGASSASSASSVATESSQSTDGSPGSSPPLHGQRQQRRLVERGQLAGERKQLRILMSCPSS